MFTSPWPIQQKRLSKEDASFVDCLHTNSGVMGLSDSIGHVDIWGRLNDKAFVRHLVLHKCPSSGIVNGGVSQQPWCLLSTPSPEPICSHNYAAVVYGYSVNRVLNACKPAPGILHPIINTTLPTLFPIHPIGCPDSLTVGPFISWRYYNNNR